MITSEFCVMITSKSTILQLKKKKPSKMTPNINLSGSSFQPC